MNCHRCATPLPENSRFCLSCGADVSGDSPERTLAVEDDPELRNKLQAELGPDFLIERELGRGGMAIVFLATEVHLGRKVAVKVLPPELTKLASGGMVERFKREARTAATLDHPHVIPIFRVSTGGTLLWYVMKYLEGEALDDILKRDKQLPLDRAAEIVKQTAEALAYAHRKSVIHRDVKPANVMLDESGWVTVTDFGIAKALDTSSLTGSGSMIGTPYYMSPEQCSGTKVTGASDQYSLAVMAYQMVSGHLPFTGETVIEIIKKHCMEPPPPLSVLRPSVPTSLVAVIERALAKSAEERFPTVLDFARSFEKAASGDVVDSGERTAESAPRHERPSQTALAGPLPVVPAAPRPERKLAEPAQRRRWLPLAGLLGVVVVAGGVGVVLWRPWAARPAQPGQAAVAPDAREGLLASAAADSGRPTAARPSDSAGAAESPGTPGAIAPTAPALLVLRGMPAGASTTLDGRPARGTRFPLSPGSRHVVLVSAPGFEPWADTLRPLPGDTVLRTVRLRSVVAQAPPTSGPVQAQAQRPGAPAPGAEQAPAQPAPQQPAQLPSAEQRAAAQAAGAQPAGGQPPQAAPAGQSAAAPPATALISVGSRPLATLTINGRPVANPASRYEVPAGLVRLHFVVTDSMGIWPFDTTVVVSAGETRNLGRIPLVRRP